MFGAAFISFQTQSVHSKLFVTSSLGALKVVLPNYWYNYSSTKVYFCGGRKRIKNVQVIYFKIQCEDLEERSEAHEEEMKLPGIDKKQKSNKRKRS